MRLVVALAMLALPGALSLDARAEEAAPAAVAATRAPAAPAPGPNAATAAAAAEARARVLDEMRREFASFGMVALLASTSAPKSGASPWSRAEPAPAVHPIWSGGNVVDGPVELSIPDDDDGGAGVPVVAVATVGRGEGLEDVEAFDHGQGRLLPIFRSHVPVRRPESVAAVLRRVPPEAIQRVLRAHHGAFRVCYEAGLRKNASLAGRVVVKLVIDGVGVVAQASDSGSDLHEPDVVACVVRAAMNLSFPASEGPSVTVVYPLKFTPPE